MTTPSANERKPAPKITASTYLWPLVMIGVGVFNLSTRRHTTWILTWNISFIAIGSLCIPMFILAQWGPYRIAQKLVRMEKSVFSGPCVYRDATDEDFRGLDRGFYDSTAAELSACGFRFLHDDVNVTITLPGQKPIVLRRFLGDEGSTMVDIAQHRGKRALKTIECESELSDGTYIATSNSGDILKSDPYPFMHQVRLTRSTSPSQLIQRHRENVQAVLAANPGVSLRSFSTLADVHAAQQRMRALVVAFRQAPEFDYRAYTAANYSKPLDDFRAAIIDSAAAMLAADRRPPPLP